MNGPLVFKAAEAIATAAIDSDSPIETIYRRILFRSPVAEELDEASSFLQDYQRQFGEDGEPQALRALCRVLFASNEFLYVE